MDTKKFIEIAKQYEETAELIKSGEITTTEMKEALTEMNVAVQEGLNILKCVLNDEESDEISNVMRVAIKAEVAKEKAKYDPTSHKEDVITLMTMVGTIDDDIGEPLFKPFMVDLLITTAEIFRNNFPEMVENLESVLKEIA